MQKSFQFAATALTAMLASQPAFACRINVEPNLPDVKNADVVVVGRISNYEVIRDEAFGAYARFAVQVDKVLTGNVGENFTATWDNSTFREPDEMAQGPFLIALRAAVSDPATSGDSTMTGSPHREPNVMTVLQAPCSRPFIFETSSDEAKITRDILTVQPN